MKAISSAELRSGTFSLSRSGVVWLLVSLLAGLLSACGGGGGSSGLSVSFDANSVSMQAMQGQGGAPAVVHATALGDATEDVFIGATVSGHGILTPIVVDIVGMSATITIRPDTSLLPGHYTGTIQMLACKDILCQRHHNGSPHAVSYTVDIVAPMTASPSSISLAAIEGGLSNAQTVSLSESGNVTASVRYSSGSGWLTVEGTGSSRTIRADAGAGGLLAGNHGATVVFSTSAPVAKTVEVPVNLSVAALTAVPATISLVAAEGGQSSTQSLTLPQEGSNTTASIRYGSGSGWLTVEGTGTSRTLRADAGAGGLLKGNYIATVVFSNSSLQVPVNLSVTDGLLLPATRLQTLKASTAEAGLSASQTVNAESGAGVTRWTASSGSPDLVLDTASGSIGGELRWHWQRSKMEAMRHGDSVSTTILVDGGGKVSPKSLVVTLENRLAQPDSADTLALQANQGGKLLVWGRGFADLPASVDRFWVSDAALKNHAPKAVTRLGSGLFELDMPALPAGRYDLRINNVSGIAAGSVGLNVLAPVERTAASIATPNYYVRGLQWDAVNQAAYYRLTDGYSLIRVDFSGPTPTQQTKVLTRLNEFTLDRDRSQVLVTLREGYLLTLDPLTLAERSRQNLGGSLPASYRSLPLALTGDRLLWVPMGGDWATLGAFNLNRDAAQVAQYSSFGPNFYYYYFYQGPWAAVSGNGRRMLMPQSASISPTPVMLWRDAAGGVETATTDLMRFPDSAPLKFFYRAGVDRAGTRWALDSAQVVDFQQTPVGSLTLPSNWTALSAAVSPDGSRTYVYALGPDAVGTYVEPTDPGPLPRVFVFDSSTPVIAGGPLPLLGQFELPAFAGCRVTQGSTACEAYYAEIQITDDARSLLVLGDRKLMLVPIASGMRQASAQTSRSRALALKPVAASRATSDTSSASVAPATGGLRHWLGPVRSTAGLPGQ